MCLGVPGKLVEIRQQDDLPMGRVEFGGILKDVCLAYTPEAQVGDYILVHVGFALSCIDEAEAQETFRLLREIAAVGDDSSSTSSSPPSLAPRPSPLAPS